MTSAVAAGAARRARVRAARDLGRGPDGPVHIRAAGSGRTGRARCGRAGVRERGSGHMRVLGVVGHVPREETDQGVRVYGARVLQHVRGHRTARVLGNEVEPRHRLAEQDGNDPEPEQQGAAGDGGECADHDAARQVRSRLANDPGALAASDVRLRHPPRRESRDHAGSGRTQYCAPLTRQAYWRHLRRGAIAGSGSRSGSWVQRWCSRWNARKKRGGRPAFGGFRDGANAGRCAVMDSDGAAAPLSGIPYNSLVNQSDKVELSIAPRYDGFTTKPVPAPAPGPTVLRPPDSAENPTAYMPLEESGFCRGARGCYKLLTGGKAAAKASAAGAGVLLFPGVVRRGRRAGPLVAEEAESNPAEVVEGGKPRSKRTGWKPSFSSASGYRRHPPREPVMTSHLGAADSCLRRPFDARVCRAHSRHPGGRKVTSTAQSSSILACSPLEHQDSRQETMTWKTS